MGSLFAGIGGIELGLERTEHFKTAWQMENNNYATQILERHWPDVKRWGNITTSVFGGIILRTTSTSSPLVLTSTL